MDAAPLLSTDYDVPVMLAFVGAFGLYILWRSRGDVNTVAEKRDRITVLSLSLGGAGFVVWRLAMVRIYGAPPLREASYDLPILLSLAGLLVIYLLWRSRERWITVW